MTLLDAVTAQLGMLHWVTRKNVDGITHDESLVRPQNGGNPANWILGHIVATRDRVLPHLGETPVLGEYQQLYRRGSHPGAEALPFGDLLTALDVSQERMMAGLARLSDEQLAAQAPFTPGGGEPGTFASLLATIAFHEAYHGGQLGIVRRMLGKEGAVA